MPDGRAYGATKMNEHSSRSHVLVMLTVTKRAARVGGSPTGGGAAALLARVGKLYLVDLAGSERLKKSMSTGAAAARRASPRDTTDEVMAERFFAMNVSVPSCAWPLQQIVTRQPTQSGPA